MSNLSITNFVTVTVTQAPQGLADYAINNLLIYTHEDPVNVYLGDYGVYKSPSDVADDWGIGSEVYEMATRIFSQTPNILSGDGSLIIAPAPTGIPNETLRNAILRLSDLVYFGGVCWAGYAPDNDEVIDAVNTCQSEKIMLFVNTYLTSDLEVGGLIYGVHLNQLSFGRCLLYTESAAAARIFAAAYAGRAMSTNFDGSNTTTNMHGKTLVGIDADPGITQSLLATCQAQGADVYTTFANVPKVFTSGANMFYDQVYNALWLQHALEVAGFNALTTNSTKIPQTEPGIAILKNAYINVLKQGVSNGYIAPGTWNSPDSFGNRADLIQNVLEQGYYIYSTPISLQSQTDRAARKAPLIQIAVKEAGAINSSNVIVVVEA